MLCASTRSYTTFPKYAKCWMSIFAGLEGLYVVVVLFSCPIRCMYEVLM